MPQRVTSRESDHLSDLVAEFAYGPHGQNVSAAVKEFHRASQEIYLQRVKDHPILRDISQSEFTSFLRDLCRERLRKLE